MSFSFFTWIREGVRQSVLMGVHDAVGHLGPRPDNDPINDRLMGFLQADQAAPPGSRRLPGKSPRKKLGRSLKDIQPDTAKAT